MGIATSCVLTNLTSQLILHQMKNWQARLSSRKFDDAAATTAAMTGPVASQLRAEQESHFV
jgi:hypothetical protein